MILRFDERPSDSPFVERIWRSHSERDGSFSSIAESRWEMVVSRLQGETFLTVRGPETRATSLDCLADGDWLGIRFTLGTIMPHLLASGLVDTGLNLPDASSKSFWLHGGAWEFPTYENADTFVARLAREGLLIRESVVEAAIKGELNERSLRTAQRHILRATGLTHSAIRQIERARYATLLLRRGVSIVEVAHAAGYFDQPHLTRALRHYIGRAPAELMDERRSGQLSFLYNTQPLP
ncbi:MAG TPA: AraC family transcriptional regulator [Ktedonobacterales bacterium]|jgi:AraC-like DNA-binding protein|nr:AraC family transcriptional regulator [Ktedonobacterales bacterium]